MCSWCLAYCTRVILNTARESATRDSKENKQADAGSRRFRRHFLCGAFVQMTSSRVRLGQSFKTVGYGSASCWGDLGAGSVEADVFYIPFIVSVQYIGY